jgi:hypothetical protein
MNHIGTLTNGLRVLNLLSQYPIRFDDGTLIGKRESSAPRFKIQKTKMEETIHLPDRNLKFLGSESVKLLYPSYIRMIEEFESSNKVDIILLHINTLNALFSSREDLGLCRAPIYRKNNVIDSNIFRRR